MNFKITENRAANPYSMYVLLRGNKLVYKSDGYTDDIHEFVEFNVNINIPEEKFFHIFDYFGIVMNRGAKYKRLPEEIALFIMNQFPNEVLLLQIYSQCVGIWYSDMCSDELKTMIELIGESK